MYGTIIGVRTIKNGGTGTIIFRVYFHRRWACSSAGSAALPAPRGCDRCLAPAPCPPCWNAQPGMRRCCVSEGAAAGASLQTRASVGVGRGAGASLGRGHGAAGTRTARVGETETFDGIFITPDSST